jgi:sn-glycerol 3-phosphate transport system substrate-binding protein
MLFRIERDVVEPRLEEAVLLDRDAAELLAAARQQAERPG